MRAKSPRVVAGVALASPAVLLSIPVLDYARSPRGDWLHPLGFQAWASVPPATWVLAVAMGVLFAVLTTRGMPAVRNTSRELSPLKLVSIWAAVGAAIVEEAFLRRVIMDAVAEVGGSVALQVCGTSIRFRAVRCEQTFFNRPLIVETMRSTRMMSGDSTRLARRTKVGGCSLSSRSAET